MNNPHMFQIDDEPTVIEARQILSNARDAYQAREISESKFREIYDACYSAFLRLTLGGRRDESEER